ncbi:MAG: hypothetical protein LBP56_07930, partial [Odoribacteraceae bacterium]|nr:hypothetical protein [Odoribacteraceae bacterium]
KISHFFSPAPLLSGTRLFIMTINGNFGATSDGERRERRGGERFFAHPYSSWERGLNEYMNGLVRQYIPKKQYFTKYKDNDITNFQHKINRRPRKVLNFEFPKERFF